MKIVKVISKKTIENPTSYEALCKKRNLATFNQIYTIAGDRSYMLKNELVFLEQAILSHVLAKLQKKKFQVISAPSFINEQALREAGYFPEKKDDHFQVQEDTYLASTSEIFINSLHKEEIIHQDVLPLPYCAISKCYRTEYDNINRGSKGLVRVHEFTKIEQFVLCKNSSEESRHWHHTLLTIAEEILTDLELPYRVVDFAKEKGPGKILMHDLQVWFPSESRYRETHSCSTYHNWQSKRTNTRHTTNKEPQLCHTNNCTAIASPRILAAVLENHQDPYGRIKIPKALTPFFNNEEWI